MSIYPEDDEVYFDDLDEDFEEEDRKLSLTGKLIILLLVLALLVGHLPCLCRFFSDLSTMDLRRRIRRMQAPERAKA